MSILDTSVSAKFEEGELGEIMPGELEPGTEAAIGSAPLSSRRTKPYMKKFKEPDSDEEVGDMRSLYNVAESWRTLLNLASCQKVMVS